MDRRESSFERWVKKVSYAGVVAGIVSVLIMVGMITLNVVLRYGFNRPMQYTNELGGYLYVIVVYLGLAYTCIKGGHITVEVVTRRLSKRMRARVDAATSLVILGVIGTYFWYALEFFIENIRSGWKSTLMEIPMWIPVGILLPGLLILCLAIVVQMMAKLRDIKGEADEESAGKQLEKTSE